MLEVPERPVDPRRSQLDGAERPGERGMNRPPKKWEVLEGPHRLQTIPQGVVQLPFAEEIALSPGHHRELDG